MKLHDIHIQVLIALTHQPKKIFSLIKKNQMNFSKKYKFKKFPFIEPLLMDYRLEVM